MFRKTVLARALTIAFGTAALGAVVVPSAMAQDAGADKVQRVIVTGSAIKRVDAETAAPVEIYTRKEIQRTGSTTVSELIKNLAAIDIQDTGELSSSSPGGSGTANVRMRGLSERNVLVLLNGRRLPTNAMADGSGAGAAVDVNVIPVSAIERVEILKDGGSAIYGADAVAGVMNFITKKNYQGLEAKGSYGQTSRSDGQEKNANLVYGVGDYEQSGFNVLATVDVFKRDPILRKDRDLTRSADFRRFGGVDGRSGYSPYGNIAGGGQEQPCPPEDLSGATCRFDFNKTLLTTINGADRMNGMVLGSFKVNDSIRAFAEFMYSENKDHFEAHPAPGVYTNADGKNVNGRFMQMGPRTTDRKGSMSQMAVGLEGSSRGIDWDVALGKGISKVSNQDSNYAHAVLFDEAIANGLVDPSRTDNSEAEIDKFRLRPNRQGKNEMTYVNAKASAPIMDLAGGPLSYAVGFSYIKEKLSDRPDQNQIDGLVFGSIQQASVNASRASKGVFGELSIPFLKEVEAQVAIRYDDIANVGTKTSPKLALRYQPLNNLMVRASYAGSFLAPSLKQMFGAVEAGANSTDEANVCAAFPTLAGDCSNFPYYEVTGSNTKLKPETGKTYNVGVVFSPVTAFSIGVDYFRINKKNEIDTPTVDQAIAAGTYEIKNGEARVLMNLQNMASTDIEGVDVDLRYTSPMTSIGKFTVRNSSTKYTKQEETDSPGGPSLTVLGTFQNPKFRNTLTLGYELGGISAALIGRTTGGQIDSDKRMEEITPGTRRFGSHTEFDLTGQYALDKNLTFSGGIKNMFDRMPPYSIMGSGNQWGSQGFANLYNVRGRYLYVGANYKFF